MEVRKAKIITVTSVKGGTGKTTVLLNLAGVYASMGKKVLIIDLDLYSSSISLSLNLNPINDVYTLSDDMNNNRYKDFDNYLIRYNKMIDVIAGPKDLRLSSQVNGNFVAPVLNKASYLYDIILIDTNHFLNELNLTVLEHSTEILYVVTNDPVDLKNMRSMVAIYKDMERENYSILLNESIHKIKHLYSKYEIDNFLKKPCRFYLSDKSHIKNIDKYIASGKILTEDDKIKRNYKEAMSDYNYIASELMIEE